MIFLFKHKWHVFLSFALLLLITLFLTHRPILQAIGDFLVVQDPLQPAGLIHVVSGDPDRIEYAIDLYQQGLAPTIFFTGGWSDYYQTSMAQRDW